MQVVVLVGPDRKAESVLGQAGRTVVYVSESEITVRRPAKADAYVLDARGQDRLPAYVQALAAETTASGFVLLTTKLEPVLMLEAMRAGIRECVAEPLVAAELEAALARICNQPRNPGAVFAFVGAKGGVGATTAAVNVALDLASVAPRQTLLIDLHTSSGDAAVFLAAEPTFSLADALDNAHRLDEAMLRALVVRTKGHLDLLAGPERGLAAAVDRAGIRSVIRCAAQSYRFTVLDVQRTEPMALDALDETGRIVVVANQELASVRSAGRMMAMLRHRYGNERLALALTRYDSNGEIGQEQVERAVGLRASYVLPSDYRKAVEALNSGTPLILGNHNRLAASFRALARDLAGLPVEPDGGRSSGFIGRLMGRRTS